jgi:hypothetical protein
VSVLRRILAAYGGLLLTGCSTLLGVDQNYEEGPAGQSGAAGSVAGVGGAVSTAGAAASAGKGAAGQAGSSAGSGGGSPGAAGQGGSAGDAGVGGAGMSGSGQIGAGMSGSGQIGAGMGGAGQGGAGQGGAGMGGAAGGFVGCPSGGSGGSAIDLPADCAGCKTVCDKGVCLAVTSLAAGELFTCAGMSNGKVYCWGDNTSGQTCVSLATADALSHPVLIPGVDTASTVLTGGTSACALLQSGQLRCWGDNSNGQLGTGDLPQKLVLVPKELMAFPSAIKDVSLGRSHACAALDSGELYCWGGDSNSELGDGQTFDENLPTLATSAPPQVVSVSAGDAFTCAGTASGQAFCWGSNYQSKTAPGDPTDPIVTPVPFPTIDHALSLSLGYTHACAVLQDHSLVCWGADHYGETSGKGVETTMPVAPIQVAALCGVAEMHVGDHFTCARLFSGEVRCFGRNDSQQISPGNPDKLYAPTLVKLPAPATHLAVGSTPPRPRAPIAGGTTGWASWGRGTSNRQHRPSSSCGPETGLTAPRP